jgi:hypothetical protein
MIYEFWDVRTNNILAAYESREEAEELIRRAVQENGPIALEWVMLLEDDPSAEDKTFIGVGSELLTFLRDAA